MTHEEATRRFYAYVWPHRAMILRTARFLTGNQSEAEDLAQETLLRAFNKIGQLDVASPATAWLTSILRNIRIDRIRVRAHAILSDAEDLGAVTMPAATFQAKNDPRDVAALLEQFSDQALIDALQDLPEDIRWTLLLIDIEQMAYQDAAEILDVPTGTVKSRMHRGHKMLHDRLLGTVKATAAAQNGGRRF